VSKNKPTDSVTLGQIYLSSAGTGVGRFEFIVDSQTGRDVEIGSLVSADTSEGALIGTVIEMRSIGSGRDPVAADLIGADESPLMASIGETMLATVQVMLSPALRPPRSGRVRPATAAEVAAATGVERMGWPVPMGVVELLDGSMAPVFADGHFLVGPEGAALIVNGTSGIAAKSSFIGVTLRSLIQHGNERDRRVGVLAFNVKGDDLLFLDDETAPGYELSDKDLQMYGAMGVSPTPFADVTVYAPSLPADAGTRSSRSDAVPLRWDLVQVLPYLKHLFPWIGGDEKVQSFMAEFRDLKVHARNPAERIDTFAKLSAWFDGLFAEAEANEGLTTPWRSHHIATLRRLRRMLEGLVARGGGLISTGSARPGEDVPDSGWTHGQVTVVDIAGLDASMQGVIVARTVERLLRAAENGTLGVDHLVVYADELNAFAPSTGGDMDTVRKVLQRVATQGRYAGVSLFGACQQASKIDALVRDQAASRAMGNTPDAELTSGAYGRLSAGVIERLATLPKGQMAFSHYSYRVPIVISFPRPAWRTGKAKPGSAPTARKARRGQAVDALRLSERSIERLTEGIPAEAVEGIIASADSAEAATQALASARTPDMRKIALHEPTQVDPNNPFAL
jgi:uncharacterized protein